MNLSRQALEERHAMEVDRHSDFLYQEKLAALPNALVKGLTERPWNFECRPGYNTWSIIDQINWKYWPLIGAAIRDKDEAEVGRLLVKAITERLRDDSREEAEEVFENGINNYYP